MIRPFLRFFELNLFARERQPQQPLVTIPPNPFEYIPQLARDLASGSNFNRKMDILKELKLIGRDSMPRKFLFSPLADLFSEHSNSD